MTPSTCQPQTDRELLILMNEKLDRIVECSEDHETRIRELEHSFWKIIGLTAFISFIAGIVGSKLSGG